MARSTITVSIADMPNLQRVLFASVELLQAVEHADAALITEDVLDQARQLRAELEALGS